MVLAPHIIALFTTLNPPISNTWVAKEAPLILPKAEPIPPIVKTYEPLPPLELASLPYAPMGTFPNSYAPANCTWGAASMKPKVPGSWGNAATWAERAIADGYMVSNDPIIGAVAQHGGGYGHVGVVVDVRPGEILLTEMNYDWHGGVRTTWQPVGRYQYIWI